MCGRKKVMAWELLLLLISGLVSDTNGGYCLSYQKPVIQICKDGTVSGTSVHIENRETPNEAVNCTCDVDLGGGKVSSVQYSGPDFYPCGIRFILGENIASSSCYANIVSNTSPFDAIYFSKNISTTGYACLIITHSKNVTITCHKPLTTPSTTASPSKTTYSTLGETTTTSDETVIAMSSVSNQETTLSTSTLTKPHPSPTVQYKSTSTEGTPNSNEGLSKTSLIGIAAGGGGTLLIILLIVVVCCIRKRKGASDSDVIITENEMYGSKPSQNNSRLSSPPYTNQAYEIQPEDIPNTVTKTVGHNEPLGRQHTIPDVSAYSELADDDDQRASDDISSMYSVVNKHKQKQTEEDTVADEQHVTTTSRVTCQGSWDR